MQKKRIAWQRDIYFGEKNPCVNRAAELVRLLYAVSAEVSMNPQLYATRDKVLWAYFEHSCFEAEAFLEEYGVVMALISQGSPISIYGNVHGLEGGRLSARFSGENLQLCKQDVSARDFDLISDLCAKITFPDETQAVTFGQILQHMDYRKAYLPIARTQLTEQLFADAPQYSADTHYRYLPFNEEGGSYLDALPIPLQKELWLLFLVEGVSPLEFEDAFNALQEGRVSAFSWELSLRLALSQAKISIQYENGGFHVIDQNGARLLYRYDSSNAAERLFLKLLFPSEPPREAAH